jgi:AAHS family 4-hydroxybenzoate transporter-like MFS transporter
MISVAAVIDVTAILDRQRLTTAFNIRLMSLTFLATLICGFEYGPMILFGPLLDWGWGESAAELGVGLLSAIVTVFIIPLTLGKLADRLGRRPVIVVTMFVFGLIALASTVLLFSVRVMPAEVVRMSALAATAFGGVLPVVVTLLNEFAPRRARATMVIFVLCGLSLGAGLRVALLSDFLQPYGGRFALGIGAFAPLAVAGLLWLTLPESVKYLALRPGRRHQLVMLLQRIGGPLDIGPGTRFVISGESNEPGFSIFCGPLALLTPLYWVVLAVMLTVFNLVVEDTLPLLASSGVPAGAHFIGVAVLQLAGLLGALFAARFLDKFYYWPVPILVACTIPVVVGIELDTDTTAPLLAAGWFCLVAAIFANVATAANIYSTLARASALSLGFAVGRFGSGFFRLLNDMDLRFLLHASRMFALAGWLLGVGLVAAVLIAPRYRALLRDRRTASG